MNLKYRLLVAIVFLCGLACSMFAASEQVSYRLHTVGAGETVYSISRIYNVPTADIYALNPQAEKGIRTGEILKIPTEKTSAETPLQYVWHSIQAKETLFSVAKRYNVSMSDILSANEGLTADNFIIGKVVRIPKSSGATVKASAPSAASGSGFIIHKVQSKETLSGISRQYNVSVEQIAALNPELTESGLKRDMELHIPATDRAVAPQPPTPVPTLQTTAESSERLPLPQVRTGALRVGLLLPFLETQEYQQAKFIEYYEGFLLAVEAMKSKGYSLELYVFDTKKGGGTSKLAGLLETSEIRDLDFIIGGVSDEEISLLSEFTKENNIGYAVPFPIKNKQPLTNPAAFLSNVSPSFLYHKAADNFVRLFAESNVILLAEESSEYNDKKDFVTLLKDNMEKRAIIHQTLTIDARLVQSLNVALSPMRKNVIVPASSSLVSLSKIIPAVRTLKQQDPSLEISLFGYPDWQTYSAQFLEDFFNYDSYIFSSFYVDNTSVAAQQFMNKYRKWYGKTLLNTYPKYGILGYDTGLYFLTSLFSNRRFYNEHSFDVEVPTIQSAFYFDGTDDDGNINTGLYFVHYKTDMTIEKNDYSK
ncbi:MAG: LysM peptidoglycan-binding domain-containing protein [Prevotella sp.]|nr:LysM peptidoglycan-binding domain-containing protein [Prevotella sp.]